MAVGFNYASMVELLQMCTRSFLQNGSTPLHMAALSGDADTVELLLNNGADVNAVDKARGWEHGARRLGPGPFTLCLRCPSQPHAPPSTAECACGPGFVICHCLLVTVVLGICSSTAR